MQGRGTMNNSNKPAADQPFVYCNNCSTLALLLFEGVPLCPTCALAAARNRDLSWIEKQAKPLKKARNELPPSTTKDRFAHNG